jgi:hypothetical protein
MPTDESMVEKMLELNEFTQVDDKMWMLELDDKMVFIQKEDTYWEVYWDNGMIQHSDEDMINGLEILADID